MLHLDSLEGHTMFQQELVFYNAYGEALKESDYVNWEVLDVLGALRNMALYNQPEVRRMARIVHEAGRTDSEYGTQGLLTQVAMDPKPSVPAIALRFFAKDEVMQVFQVESLEKRGLLQVTDSEGIPLHLEDVDDPAEFKRLRVGIPGMFFGTYDIINSVIDTMDQNRRDNETTRIQQKVHKARGFLTKLGLNS